LDEVNVERAGEPRRDLILQDGNVRTIAVETIRPNVVGGLKIRKRYVDPDLVSGPPHRPLYGPANAKVLAERLKIDLLVLISKGRPAPDHKRARHSREIGCQIGRDGVGEIVLLRIVVEVREWQDNE